MDVGYIIHLDESMTGNEDETGWIVRVDTCFALHCTFGSLMTDGREFIELSMYMHSVLLPGGMGQVKIGSNEILMSLSLSLSFGNMFRCLNVKS